MGSRVKIVNGEPVTWDQGQWRPLTPSEATAYESSPLQAFGLGVTRAAAQIASAPAMLSTLGQGWDLQGDLAPSPALTDPAQAVGQFQPNAVLAGETAANLATVPPSSWMALARLPQTMAQRVQGQLAQRGATAAAGMERTLGEATGFAPVQSIERAVSSMGGFNGLQRRREAAVVQSALKAIGASGDRLGAETLGANATRIGQGMDQILAQDFTLGPQTREALAGLSNTGSTLKGLIARVQETEGPVPGQLVQNLRRALTDRARAAMGSDGLLADDLHQAADHLLDDVGKQLPEGSLADWRKLRIEYKNQVALESIPEVRHSGTLSARQAGNALTRSYGNAYVRGKGIGDPATDEFMGLTRNLAALKPYPDSGTAARLAPIIGAVSGAATGDSGPDAVGRATVGAAAPVLVSSAIGRALIAAGRYVPYVP